MAADFAALKQDLTRRMDGAIELLKKEFTGLRTGRASPAHALRSNSCPLPSIPASPMISPLFTSRLISFTFMRRSSIDRLRTSRAASLRTDDDLCGGEISRPNIIFASAPLSNGGAASPTARSGPGAFR